jgi:hypothetical protein
MSSLFFQKIPIDSFCRSSPVLTEAAAFVYCPLVQYHLPVPNLLDKPLATMALFRPLGRIALAHVVKNDRTVNRVGEVRTVSVHLPFGATRSLVLRQFPQLPPMRH